MVKKLMLLSAACLTLSGCSNLPSPQDTTPSNPAQCAALRAQLLRAPMNTNGSTSSANADAQNAGIQEQYHHQCE